MAGPVDQGTRPGDNDDEVSYACGMATLPEFLRPIFWNTDFDRLDAHRDRDHIMARVMEHGRMTDVAWLRSVYADEELLDFFRRGPHPEVSRRTMLFWSTVLDDPIASWPTTPAWRRNKNALWHE